MHFSRLTLSAILLSLVVFANSLPKARADILMQYPSVSRDSGGMALRLPIDQLTPFRTYLLDSPRRLVVDFGEAALRQFSDQFVRDIPEISAVRYGLFQPENFRMVLDIDMPMAVQSAEIQAIDGQDPVILIHLGPVSAAVFSQQSVASDGNIWAGSLSAPQIAGRAGAPLIAIDAGHGGIDQGAVVDDVFEKDINLQMAKKMRDVLLESGAFRVVLTREADVFVPLGARVEIARRAGAVAFISLHADVVTRGRARGTTVFSLSHADADQEAVTIATLENRGDLVAGISVEGEDDQITSVLLQLAHRETDALSNRFADVMAEALWFQNDTG